MKITRFFIKRHKKTQLDFNNPDECINFFEMYFLDNPKAQKEIIYLPSRLDNYKARINGLVRIFKKLNGTNATIEVNSPIKVTLNGHYNFKKVKRMEDPIDQKLYDNLDEYMEAEQPNYAD